METITLTAESQILRLMREEFARLQTKNPSYSLRAFAKRLRLMPSATSDILNGKREITPLMGGKILTGLNIDPETSNAILSRLLLAKSARNESPARKYQQVEMDHYHVIADWYYFAILSLSETEDFRDDPEWIAERLNITKPEATRALERLERLGLLARDENQKLRPTGLQFETSHDIGNLSLRKSHAQTLEMAAQSLRDDPVNKRDISAITMAIDPDLLPEAKAMIRDFRRNLCAFLESGKKKEVYRFSAQLFPLSKGTKK